MTLRLILVAHAPTHAATAAAFPLDEPILPAWRAEAEALRGVFGRVDAGWTSPARRAVETAAALDLPAEPEPAIRDLDLGRWAGRTLEAVSTEDPAGLQLWTTSTGRAPHGGESIDLLLGRVASWMDRVKGAQGRVVAVTHAAVIRAAIIHALRADGLSFWRIDVAPLSVSELHANGGRWSVCCLNRTAPAPCGARLRRDALAPPGASPSDPRT